MTIPRSLAMWTAVARRRLNAGAAASGQGPDRQPDHMARRRAGDRRSLERSGPSPRKIIACFRTFSSSRTFPGHAALSSIRRIGDNPHVLPGLKRGTHLVNIKDPWGVIRRAAGLDDVRPHDLRHSFASVGAASGLGLPIIRGLLGHTQPATTARYAHLAAAPLRDATELIGEKIAAALASGDGTSASASTNRVAMVGTRCTCCKAMVGTTASGNLCEACASGQCRRGRRHRRAVADGRVRREPAATEGGVRRRTKPRPR